MWRGEYLTLYSPVIDDCAEVKRLPFRVTHFLSNFNHKSFIAIQTERLSSPSLTEYARISLCS